MVNILFVLRNNKYFRFLDNLNLFVLVLVTLWFNLFIFTSKYQLQDEHGSIIPQNDGLLQPENGQIVGFHFYSSNNVSGN